MFWRVEMFIGVSDGWLGAERGDGGCEGEEERREDGELRGDLGGGGLGCGIGDDGEKLREGGGEGR